MIRPVKMKQVRVTVLDKDVVDVLKYLGRRAVIQFSEPSKKERERAGSPAAAVSAATAGAGAASFSAAAAGAGAGAAGAASFSAAGAGAATAATASAAADKQRLNEVQKALGQLTETAAFLQIDPHTEITEDIDLPGEEEARSVLLIADTAGGLEREIYNISLERQALEERLKDAIKRENLPPELDGLLYDSSGANSFLNIRFGHIEAGKRPELENALQGRAVVVPFASGAPADGGSETILVASSKVGRFAMDSSLKDAGFVAVHKADAPPEKQPPDVGRPQQDFGRIQQDFGRTQPDAGRPPLESLSSRVAEIDAALDSLEKEKEKLRRRYGTAVQRLTSSYTMAQTVLNLKQRLSQTRNTFELSGWVEAPLVASLVKDLDEKTAGRVSVLSYDSWEVPAVREGREKVPVKLRHNRLVKSFEPVVLSYGAPLYGTIDPTPFTAVLFSLLFGVMFGDVGQGAVLFLLGVAAGRARMFQTKRHFSGPLKIAGTCAMLTGLFYGSVFSNETLLEAPTMAVTGLLARTAAGKALGIRQTAHILHLMPESGAIDKLFYFFGFTLAIGVIINSLGIVLNITNGIASRRWARAFFSKHGLTGGLFFWYAIFLAIRAIAQKSAFRFLPVDAVCLAAPVFLIVAGPLFLRLAERKKLFEEGLFAFLMEGIVEILETLSGYISNTVSFLRVGAFALSHAVLSFIIFKMAEQVAHVPLGPAWSLVIIIFGNALIIVLEGMVVAIQVIRLQYYEFFSKFFTETGVEFSPFHFKRGGAKAP